MGPLDPQGIHETGAVLGEEPGGIRHVGLIAPPQTPVVIDEDLKVFGEFRNLKDSPGGAAYAGPRDENKWVALAAKLIIEMDIVHFGPAAFDRLQFLHWKLP